MSDAADTPDPAPQDTPKPSRRMVREYTPGTRITLADGTPSVLLAYIDHETVICDGLQKPIPLRSITPIPRIV
jgi:hypothetical protein